MMFVATLVHPPELCLARKEFGTEAGRWVDGMNDLAKKLGVKVLTEHIPVQMNTHSTLSSNQMISKLLPHSSLV